MSGPELPLGPTSRFMALLQPRPVLVPLAPPTTEGREERAAELVLPLMGCSTRENFSSPSLTALLGRVVSTSHLGSIIEPTQFGGTWMRKPRGHENGRERVQPPLVAMKCW